MAELRRPGAVLNYEVWGEDAVGSWVTLVNGHTRPLNDFRLLGRHLVEQGHRVVALDNRGAGRTTVDKPFAFADFVDDVVALWDELDVETTGLAGISMGGFIALTLAGDHAARVARLALISTSMNQTRIRRDDSPWTTDLNAVDAKLRPYFTKDFASRNEVLVKSMVKQIAKNVESGQFQEMSDLQKRAALGFEGSALARRVTAPTLVIHGAEDEIIPATAARDLAAAIPGAKLELLPHAGHLLLAERPRELYGFLGDWFA